MALTNNQINELIAYNLPNNNQQLISPAKVREVLLAMQAFSEDNIYVPSDTLQSVTDRGAATNKTITLAGISIGNSGFFATVGAATLAANRSILLPNENGTLLTNNSALDATKVSGVLDPANIPLMYSGIQIVSSGGIADLTAPQQAQILRGAIVTTTDGRRWTYTGTGSKTSEASYILVADVTPEWSVIANKPSTFTPSAHTHDWADITTGLPTTAAGYGITDAVVTGGSYSNPTWLASVAWSKLTGVPSTFTPSAHSHAWSDITSGLPTTLAGYGITNGQVALVSGTNIKTINGNTLLGSGDLAIGGSSQWVTTGSDIYYNTGNVAIGAASAGAKLDVVTNAIGTGTAITTGLRLANLTTGSGQQNSPMLVFQGRNNSDQSMILRLYMDGAALEQGLRIERSINGAAYVRSQIYCGDIWSSGNFNGTGVSISGTVSAATLAGALTTSVSNMATTSVPRVSLSANDFATAIVPIRYSPSIRLQGQGWMGSASQAATFNMEVRPTSGTNPIAASLVISSDINAAGYTDRFTLTNTGNLTIGGTLTTASPSGATATWKLGRYITVSSVSLITNRCVQVEIDGAVYYLGVVL